MCIYMGVRKFWPFKFQNSGHSYTFFKKGVGGGLSYIWGAEKGAHIRTMSHIGYPLPGFKPFMVQDLLKRR